MTKIIQSRFDIPKCLMQLEHNGKKHFGEHFTILERDHYVVVPLLVYFLKDHIAAAEIGISLSKGIALTGPIGCGKTSLMTLFRTFSANSPTFSIKSCRQVSFEFNKDGFEVIQKYSNGFNYENQTQAICFDDLGTENTLKYYGNDCNVMTEILLNRYDQFITRKMLTHITTNLNSDEIGQLYGPRVRSRMREMFNLICFDRKTKDKRVSQLLKEI